MNFLPPGLDPCRIALFLDCDGTLAEIVEIPDQARVEPAIIDILDGLLRVTGGALAVVSGRSIEQLDHMLAPLVLPVAGVHGAERRDGQGVEHHPDDASAIEAAVELVREFAASHAGLICETKPGAVALHYRMRPELSHVVAGLAIGLAGSFPHLRLLRGKMVVELSSSGRTKGDAVRDFMREPPFAGRLPIFVGDDVTDEAGFAAAEKLGGIGIKIGSGRTHASQRFADIVEFQTWLAGLHERWVGQGEEGRETSLAVGTDALLPS